MIFGTGHEQETITHELTKRTNGIKICLAFACILLLRLNAAPAGLTELVTKAQEALIQGETVQALALFQQARSHAEGQPAAALGIAQARTTLARQQSGTWQASWEAWLAVIPYEGLSVPVRRGMAESYLGLGQTRAASEQWALAYAADPSDASLWYQLAPIHRERGEWDAARQAYSILATIDPDTTETLYWAGLLQMTNEPSQARQFLLSARRDPFYRQRADRLLATLDALADTQTPAHVAGLLGVAYLEVGQADLARIQLQHAVELEPTLANAWAYLSLAENQSGHSGWQSASQAIALAPDNALVHSMMGHHWLWQERPDLARPEFVTAWRLTPENPAHLADIASTYQLEGDLHSAEAWYQAAIRLAPDDPTFWILLARFHLDTVQRIQDGGLPAAQHAVALAPENPAALDVLGWAQFLSGQFDRAETNLLAAQQRDPSNPAVHYHLGSLYANQQAWNKAGAAFEMAIILDTPYREGLYSRLAKRALEKMGGKN